MKLLGCVVWLMCIGAAFSFLLEQQSRPFDESGMYSHTQQADLPTFLSIPLTRSNELKSSSKKQIIHWLDPQCGCYKFAKSLVLKQVLTAQADETHLVILKSSDTFWDKHEIANHTLSDSEYKQTQQFMPASPAASINNSNNSTVSYLGPHNSGAYCGQGKSFIAIVMSNLRNGFDPQFVNVDESGCFCRW